MTGPRRRGVGPAAAALILAVLAGACAGDDPIVSGATTPTASSSPAPSTTATAPTATTPTTAPTPPPGSPAEVSEHPEDWVLPGRDLGNSRAAGESPITSATVERLGPVWEAELGGQLSTVPLIVGDTVYAQDGTGAIVAVDGATGGQRWRSDPSGFNIGPFGVAVVDGRVFGVHGSTGVVALDASDGTELWVTEITATPTTGIDIQPVVHDGLVYVSTVPVSTSGIYTGGDRGVIHALDAITGEVRWTFDTVDSDDVWGNPDVNSGGGSWYPPAIDPVRGLVYWGVANPAPFPGTAEFPNGTSRPGPNLYTDSVVALDLGSGELAWYHQVTPHDILDHDLIHTMLVDLPDGGDIVVTAGKGGEVVGVDPDTGEPRWETAVGLHQNDDLEALDGPTIVAPGTFGGVLTPPAWADGTVYVATVNAPVELRPDTTAYFGATMGQMDGEVVAIDAATGAVRWATAVPGDPLGAVTVVNDLILTTLLAGELVALDRDTGEIVHTLTLPGGTNGWMSVAGDTIVIPVGQAVPPRLVAYRLR